jgi:hypothetical protein
MDNIINQSIQNIQKSQKIVTKIENELKKGIKTNKNNRVKIEFKPTIKIEVYGNASSAEKKKTTKKASTTKKKTTKKTTTAKKKTTKKASAKKKTVRNKLYNFFNPK